jgi:transcriptional regulator with XRE-family HTH domain
VATLFGGKTMTLKQYRTKLGMTQQELANAVGICLLSVQRYESGRRIPAVDVAKKICDELQVPHECRLEIFGEKSA